MTTRSFRGLMSYAIELSSCSDEDLDADLQRNQRQRRKLLTPRHRAQSASRFPGAAAADCGIEPRQGTFYCTRTQRYLSLLVSPRFPLAAGRSQLNLYSPMADTIVPWSLRDVRAFYLLRQRDNAPASSTFASNVEPPLTAESTRPPFLANTSSFWHALRHRYSAAPAGSSSIAAMPQWRASRDVFPRHPSAVLHPPAVMALAKTPLTQQGIVVVGCGDGTLYGDCGSPGARPRPALASDKSSADAAEVLSLWPVLTRRDARPLALIPWNRGVLVLDSFRAAALCWRDGGRPTAMELGEEQDEWVLPKVPSGPSCAVPNDTSRSDDGSGCFVYASERSVYLCDCRVASRAEPRAPRLPSRSISLCQHFRKTAVTALCSPSSTQVVMGMRNGTIQLKDLRQPPQSFSFETSRSHACNITAVCAAGLSKALPQLLSRAGDGEVRLWDLRVAGRGWGAAAVATLVPSAAPSWVSECHMSLLCHSELLFVPTIQETVDIVHVGTGAVIASHQLAPAEPSIYARPATDCINPLSREIIAVDDSLAKSSRGGIRVVVGDSKSTRVMDLVGPT